MINSLGGGGVVRLTGFANRPGYVDKPRAERAHDEALVLELDGELGRRHHKRSLRHPVRGHVCDLDGTDEGRVGAAGAEGDDLLGRGCAEERNECIDGVDRAEDVDLVLQDRTSPSTVIVKYVPVRMTRLRLTYRIYKVRVEFLRVGATATKSEMIQTIGERDDSQIIETFDHIGKLHLCGDVEQNIQLPANDARDLLCCVLESQINHE